MKTLTTLAFAFGIISFVSAQLPKGDRILAYQVDPAENMNYDNDFALAKDACMESIHFSSNWSDYDSTSGNFDVTYIANFLDIINVYMPANGTKVELQIAPVNTNVLELPADLMSTTFDDPILINRFKTLLDTVFMHIPDLELSALNIGNESDIYFGTDANLYNEFGVFLDSVVPHAKQLYFNIHGEELKVGTTLTFNGLTDPLTASLCAPLNTNRDIVAVTYYPLESNFHMKPTSVVSADFDTLVSLYPDVSQPIYFVECGYASSAVCSSSEAQQADFFTEVFSAWDDHYDNIKYLTIFKTTDWSQADIQIFEQYYGISDPAFLEYLRTLGVRTWAGDGTDKLAFDRIKCELNDRNWCAVPCSASINESEPEVAGCVLYPSPGETLVNMDVSGNIEHIEVITLDGKNVEVQANFSQKTVNVSNWQKGIYLFRIKTENGWFQAKFEKF
ncbi:MAG: hypothetical protein Crog4KO_07560 [Crocinitomicaceae bacterium]